MKKYEMSDLLNEDLLRRLSSSLVVPIIIRGFVSSWLQCKWDLEKWCAVFGDREIPFRCMKKDFLSDDPCWERRCTTKKMTFKSFLDNLTSNEDWMYFDYKYVQQWFTSDSELVQGLSWKQFGYPDKGAADSTLWVGSRGAHTPAHQDTYGINIVAQLHGKKRWILFPPETGGLKPTRVPYEESSVYSELNFYCPRNLDVFNGLTGGRVAELNAGDALLLPRGWWHYVQNIDSLNIALNIWLPHEKDCSARVSEALIKILVAQVCKDLPQETAKHIVNPNEDDVSDTPLTVLFLQLETVANTYLDRKRKARRLKRQKTCEDDCSTAAAETEVCDLNTLLENKANRLETAKDMSSADLIDLIKGNIQTFADKNRSMGEDESDGGAASLCLTKAVIDAFSQSNVIDIVKQNLLARLS